jgi:hypothetical protein
MRSTSRKGGAHAKRDRSNDDRTNAGVVEDRPVIGTRDRFGGLDLPAAFAGTMAALGMLAVLGAIASAWSSAYNQTLDRDEVLSITGLVAGLAIVIVSCLFGGWVTGRTARYHGSGNGLLTGVLLLVITAGLGWLLGNMADEATSFRMPDWITDDASSNEAITAAAVAAGIALLSCALGGALGSFWHRRVDRSLVTETENNAFAPYPEDQRLVTAPPAYEDRDDDTRDGDRDVVDLDEQPETRKRATARSRRD